MEELITFRQANPKDQSFLNEMLYQAIYLPETEKPSRAEVWSNPELNKYTTQWGKPGDFGLIAFDNEKQLEVGACWCRQFTESDKGYGYVDEQTPELSIALLPEYKGRGIGTQLLLQFLEQARPKYRTISLSVDPDNPVMNWYQKYGFQIVGQNGASYIMLKIFRK